MPYKDPGKRKQYNADYKARQREETRQERQGNGQEVQGRNPELTKLMEGQMRREIRPPDGATLSYLRTFLQVFNDADRMIQDYFQVDTQRVLLEEENHRLDREIKRKEERLAELKSGINAIFPDDPLKSEMWGVLQEYFTNKPGLEGFHDAINELAQVWGHRRRENGIPTPKSWSIPANFKHL